ncbi:MULTISPECIES: hypothetical protein [Halococcus]|uniref:Uncharacterized protein n=1 Tax=Halococcus saccharolyticus DSM 5350 TaxID=1227455 RepID=M0MCT3_9EURY|nr:MULTISPECIES: hypothetical protein [Halococcus]EMA43567.1 hypothetical protein C449_13447 [Halococcus saccharolyticus DSM 5350]
MEREERHRGKRGTNVENSPERITAADRPGHGRVGGIDDPVARSEYGDDPEAVREAQRDAAGDLEDAHQHATVYQLADGESERPREIRHDPNGASLSIGDLIEHYELAGEEDVVDLSDLWERWNRGSGQESQAFVEAETRSLSVGDIVVLDGDAYRCDRIGWTAIELCEDGQTAE